jgi:hypothetical protein
MLAQQIPPAAKNHRKLSDLGKRQLIAICWFRAIRTLAREHKCFVNVLPDNDLSRVAKIRDFANIGSRG